MHVFCIVIVAQPVQDKKGVNSPQIQLDTTVVKRISWIKEELSSD